jgi:hypothetical protein
VLTRAWCFFGCCCPPRPNPSILDHNTWQGMPWEHIEGLLTPRWWPESVFPGFPEMHYFCPPSKQAHTPCPLGANFTPLLFALMGMVWPSTYLRTKVREIWTKTRILHPYHLSGREMAKIQPPTLTLDHKLINFLCRSVSFMYRNHWVTSDVQFRKGASIPPFGVGLGWAD